MPRQRRYELIDVPQHVVQRGNNRGTTFLDQRDYRRYLDALCDAARERRCDVHAYVLMRNHVHLLVTPREPKAVSALMQSVGRRYVRYFNDRHGRTGTLWEGRHWASLVGSGSYFWNCHRYIELNPVRAGLVADPAGYPWSSHHRNASGRPDPIVTEHAEYTALGGDLLARAIQYKRLFDTDLDPAIVDEIRQRLNTCRLFGADHFLDEMAEELNRRVRPGRPGRPRRALREIAV